MMKTRTIFNLILLFLVMGLSLPAKAQWDLGNSSAVDSINSGGTGSMVGNVQPNAANANGSPGQPYLNEAANNQAMKPNNVVTQYNQYGQLQNSAFGQPSRTLAPTQTPTLSIPITIGLPRTSLDSFVLNAGGNAELIYGDEGTDSIPPLFGFTSQSTINAGIVGQRAKTITTGHPSNVPNASGN